MELEGTITVDGATTVAQALRKIGFGRGDLLEVASVELYPGRREGEWRVVVDVRKRGGGGHERRAT